MTKLLSKDELAGLLSLDDIQSQARKSLDRGLYEYLASGSDDEQTLAENRSSWKQILLKPRVMRSVAALDTSCFVIGSRRRARLPIFISPAGVHSLCDGGAANGGELATARAAEKAGVVMGESQHATQTLEDVARACPNAPGRWFQCYLLKDRSITEDMVRRAVAAGYTAIVLTVDSVVFGSREADARNNFDGLPPNLSLVNYDPYYAGKGGTAGAGAPPQHPESGPAAFQAHFDDRTESAWDQNTEKMFATDVSWADVTWLKGLLQPGMPLLVKGILRGDDAVCAIEAGADGIVVSNHGGRQLDGCVAAIDALPAVVRAVRLYRAQHGRLQRRVGVDRDDEGLMRAPAVRAAGPSPHGPSFSASLSSSSSSSSLAAPAYGYSSAPVSLAPVSSSSSSSSSSSLSPPPPSLSSSLAAAAGVNPPLSPSALGGARARKPHHVQPSKAESAVECVAEEIYPVYLDGGVRRGTDVVKALALGAAAVLVGKPLFFSLAVGGEDGVHRMFDIMEKELRSAMALCGCPTLAAVRNTPDLACVRSNGRGDSGTTLRSAL